MSRPIISIRGLGKRYRIGRREVQHDTLRDAFADALRTPWRRLRGGGKVSSDEFIWALRDVSFDVEAGEVVGVIGRNGAGKTTLLKILSRITEPTEGWVGLNGRAASLLEVGTGFHPELTGRENIYLSGAILGMRRAEIKERFDEIVAFAEIEKFLDTPVKRYSSGMYVRLAFAVAAHLQPEILLVDEVLAVGDAAFQKKCLGKIDAVASQGRTVLLVSHNMLAVQKLCTRAVLLSSGRAVAIGPVADVVARYLEQGRERAGEIRWDDPDSAPGDDQLRLAALRITAGGSPADVVDMDQPFRIEVDYRNLENNARRLISIHLYNSSGVCVLTSANLPGACVEPDPWHERPYPRGLFRTICEIPAGLLNDDTYSVTVFVNGRGAEDHIVELRDALVFTVRDSGAMRGEYMGKWLGVVRPRLRWETMPLAEPPS